MPSANLVMSSFAAVTVFAVPAQILMILGAYRRGGPAALRYYLKCLVIFLAVSYVTTGVLLLIGGDVLLYGLAFVVASAGFFAFWVKFSSSGM